MNNTMRNFKNKQVMGLRLGMAEGGIVRGQGGPTDDDVPMQVAGKDVNLSNSEAVLPVKTVQALGGPEAVEHLIETTNGKPPVRGGLRAGGEYFTGTGGDVIDPRALRPEFRGQAQTPVIQPAPNAMQGGAQNYRAQNAQVKAAQPQGFYEKMGRQMGAEASAVKPTQAAPKTGLGMAGALEYLGPIATGVGLTTMATHAVDSFPSLRGRATAEASNMELAGTPQHDAEVNKALVAKDAAWEQRHGATLSDAQRTNGPAPVVKPKLRFEDLPQADYSNEGRAKPQPGVNPISTVDRVPVPAGLNPAKMLSDSKYTIPEGTGAFTGSLRGGQATLIDTRPATTQGAAAINQPLAEPRDDARATLVEARQLLKSSNTDDRVIGAKLLRHVYPQMVTSTLRTSHGSLETAKFLQHERDVANMQRNTENAAAAAAKKDSRRDVRDILGDMYEGDVEGKKAAQRYAANYAPIDPTKESPEQYLQGILEELNMEAQLDAEGRHTLTSERGFSGTASKWKQRPAGLTDAFRGYLGGNVYEDPATGRVIKLPNGMSDAQRKKFLEQRLIK